MESLPDPPTDGITSLLYLPTQDISTSSNLLASTSWDGCIRIHDTTKLTKVLSHQMDSGPLLSLTKTSPFVITGGLDGSVRKLDIQTSSITYLGRHVGTEQQTTQVCCSCLSSLQNNDVIASAGWDSQFHLWDIRTPPPKPVFTLNLPGKAFSMDSFEKSCLIATSGRRICKIDTRKGLQEAEEGEEEEEEGELNAFLDFNNESSLKYQTRTLRYFPNGSGYALGSVEGRVAVEFFDDKKNYAFKCHRSNDVIYPVNAIEFHEVYSNVFATGGADGTVVVWDASVKRRMLSLPKFATSISCLAFSCDGSELAIGSSYTFEDGEREHPRDEIFIKTGMNEECRPKPK